MEKVLLEDEKYSGKYVALQSLTDNTVIAHGDDPFTVRELAWEKGATEPLIFFVSEPENHVIPCY